MKCSANKERFISKVKSAGSILKLYLVGGILFLQHPLETPIKKLQHAFPVKNGKALEIVLLHHFLD